MNSNPTLSNAGTWIPVTDESVLSSKYHGELANTFHAVIQLDATGRYGLVVSGWGYSGWPPTLSTVAPVNVALLTPDSSGALAINTSQYIADPVTNGASSAIVADFNGDGRSDIVLIAHNESPFLAMASTAWMSNAGGGFTKVTLNDLVMAHDAELVAVNGKPAIATGTFTTDNQGNAVKGALTNPIYTFTNGSFVASVPTNVGKLSGMDTTIISGSSIGLEIARGDVNHVVGGIPDQNIEIYAYDGKDVTSLTPVQSIVPYLSTLPQYKNFPADIVGPGLTHTSRLWADDLNNDGKQDILAGESMWSQTNPAFPSVLQVLINKGDGTFTDATTTLNPDMGLNQAEMDYNPNFVDLDHSGIKTYLFAGSTSWGSMARQSDYVLLNDGTGHLYVALHDQFSTLAQKVFGFLGQKYSDTSTPPRFIAIPQPDGSLNFVAEVAGGVQNTKLNLAQSAYKYINVPLHYNPTSDFTQNVNISDRNHSMLMRTWAGNDTFGDNNANAAPAHLDGGLGIDTAAYGKAAASYKITHNVDGSCAVVGNGIADTLVNIERLQFADSSIALDINGAAGSVAKTIGAVFGVAGLNNKTYIGQALKALDTGTSYEQLLVQALNTALGPNATSAQIVDLVYFNVIGSAPPVGAKTYYMNLLDSGAYSLGKLAAIAADTVYNAAHIDLVGLAQTGLGFIPAP